MTIYEKLSAIWGAIQYMQKDDHLKFGSTNYKALSEEKVTSIMREQMVKQGLIVFPIEMTSSRQGQISHVDVKYRIVNVENPEEYIEVVSCGDGADTQDKGAGKAMTYAYKYMWLRVFGIPTGEDPDKIMSDEIDENEKKAAADEKAKKSNAPLAEHQTRCDKCGGKVTSVSHPEFGKIAKAALIMDAKPYNQILCANCLMAEHPEIKDVWLERKKQATIAEMKERVAEYGNA